MTSQQGSSQKARQARTLASASRHGAPWTTQEDAELAACQDDEQLEAFALRYHRTFASVEQRRKRHLILKQFGGTGWIT